jgi:hypothetical protein
MPIAERSATTAWDGDLANGQGKGERRQRRRALCPQASGLL